MPRFVGVAVFVVASRLVALALLVTAVAQIRFPARVGGETAALTYLGGFRASTGASRGDFDCSAIALTGRRVSNVNRLLVTQGCYDDDATWAFAPIEMTDPVSAGTAGSYSTSSTVTDLPLAVTVTDWKVDGVGAAYNFWDADDFLGDTFNSSGVQQDLELGGGAGEVLVRGITYNENGDGDCCLYLTTGNPYGVYPSPSLAPYNTWQWTMYGAKMTSQGNVTRFGPIRTCAGDWGDGVEQCGSDRASLFWDMPDGSMGGGSANGATQQGYPQKANKGPSLFRWATWPQPGDTYGWGSTRNGDAQWRTTDRVATTKYLAHYEPNLNYENGKMLGGDPVRAARRPPIPSGTTPPTYAGATCEEGNGLMPYCFEPPCTAGTVALGVGVPALEADPAEASFNGLPSNTGTWTAQDQMSGGSVIEQGSKTFFIVLANWCTGHTWYRTFSDTTCHSRGIAAEDANVPPGGPQGCPRHADHEDAPTTTGPVCTLKEAVLLVYDFDDLQATPDYSPDPVQVIYLARQWGVKHWYTGVSNTAAGATIGGLWCDPVEKKCYFGNWGGDAVTDFGETKPVFHTFSFDPNLAPAPASATPLPILPVAAGVALWSVGSLFRRASRATVGLGSDWR
jgi:hypothetical protein